MDNLAQKRLQAVQWFNDRGLTPFPFQLATWEAHLGGQSGLVNAPTGSGKTYSLAVPILLEGKDQKSSKVQALWITPIRALSKEIQSAVTTAAEGLGVKWKVGVRTGDTKAAEKLQQKEKRPL